MPVKQIIEQGLVPVKVYTDDIEASARQQLVNLSQLPIIHHHVAAMPDVHAGIGATVGSVIATKEAVIPAAVGVDIGCFAGDTKIHLLDGTEATLKDLVERGGEHWVFVIGPNHRVTGAKAIARQTRAKAALMLIQLDSNERIRCTPDHKFMLRDGTWCEAQHLQPGSSLMPLYIRMNFEGYTEVVHPGTDTYQRFHWALATPEGYKFYAERGIRHITSYMSEHRDEFLQKVAGNGKRGKKYLVSYNQSEKGRAKSKENVQRLLQVERVCSDCGEKFMGHLRVNAHKRHAHRYNHKVKCVEWLEEREDVYCLTVPGYENFALSAGVFVHNCGMIAARTSLTADQLDEKSLKRVFDQITRDVPVGRDQHREGRELKDAAKPFQRDLTEIFTAHPQLGKRFPRTQNWVRQMGTLGGGNHFIEVCVDESSRVWVMLHSGSRGIGNAIGTYFIELARKDMEQQISNLPDRDLAYLREGTQHFDDYVGAVGWAQRYAAANREAMMDLVLAALRRHLPAFEVTTEAVNCHHNYVERERHFGKDVWVTRKGAIRAGKGELGIIPGSMGVKSFIVRGLGSEDSFDSCAHGAGRRMSRTAAQKKFTQADLAQQTAGVICRKDSGVIDEIPGAYKSIDEVMENQRDLVEVVHTLKQVLCVKG